MPHAIEFKDVDKWFAELHVLADVNLDVDTGEVIVVCGPSGSGKSTLIRCVNVLERIQQGDIVVLGRSITAAKLDMPKLRASVGMVFQQFNLFAHMTVLQNIVLAPTRYYCRAVRCPTRPHQYPWSTPQGHNWSRADFATLL